MSEATINAEIHDIRTISQNPEHFHGWPTIARRRNGELLVACSGSREGHVCPYGKVELIRSHDAGQTWSAPEIVADGPIDDRDAGVLETQKGTLIVNWFTSTAWLKQIERAEQGEIYMKPHIDAWKPVRDRTDQATKLRHFGLWCVRSEDGGQTWSEPISTVTNSPHGPTELSDGRLLYIGRLLDEHPDGSRGAPFVPNRLSVSESRDDGKTWQYLADVPAGTGHDLNNYHEPYAVEAADGRIVGQIRHHHGTDRDKWETIQCESFDGGRTWTEPRSIGVYGFPSHLLRLQDDRLLMTYGVRREPWGNQARISEDHGQTWSEPIIILGEGEQRDLGYPSTTQLDDGSLLSVWYEQTQGPGTNAELRLAHWSLK